MADPSTLQPPIPSSEARGARITAITSGKGGVGKTSLICNIAARLGQLGKEVLLIDADLGLANVDIIMGITPRATLEQLFRGDKTLEDILLPGPPGVTILPSGSGVKELTHLSDTQIMELMTALDELDRHFDVLLIDTGAGIGKNVLDFNAAAQDVLVVTNPEPTSITDAYAIIKVLATTQGRRSIHLLVNQTRKPSEGRSVRIQLQQVVDRYVSPGLGEAVQLDLVGEIPSDPAVREWRVRRQLLAVHSLPGARGGDRDGGGGHAHGRRGERGLNGAGLWTTLRRRPHRSSAWAARPACARWSTVSTT